MSSRLRPPPRHHVAQSYTELHEWNATKLLLKSHVMARPRCLIIDFGNVIAFFDHRKAAASMSTTAPTSSTSPHTWVFLASSIVRELESKR
jgi:hypothetical protein